MMRPSSGRLVVPRMGERDPEESRDNQVDVAFGQSSAIVVGPLQVLEPISPTNDSASSIWRISRGAEGIVARQCRAHIDRHEHQV